jgi:hypothetical protein
MAAARGKLKVEARNDISAVDKTEFFPGEGVTYRSAYDLPDETEVAQGSTSHFLQCLDSSCAGEPFSIADTGCSSEKTQHRPDAHGQSRLW